MLDQEIKNQLAEHFNGLESHITFSILKTTHADANELQEMLGEISACNPAKIKILEDSESADFPSFRLLKNGAPTGIQFDGIPGGHEFSSLVLAILNLDGKGRLPDPQLQKRIRAIQNPQNAPIRLKTYISLTCENCPDVVQALNLIATLRNDFHHTMIDGVYKQDDISRLGIQGVPSVVAVTSDGIKETEELIHSGKISMLDLIAKLETKFGKTLSAQTQTDLGTYDVAVIGAGPAGASAAIYSARKGLKTAIIAERFGGQVQDTKGIENLISTLYTEGKQLAAALQKHVESYGITILEYRRVKSITPAPGPGPATPAATSNAQTIFLESGETLQAKQTIIATGAKWRELNVPGEKEYIGRGVAFCPHCDGPYYKDKKVVVVGGGNSGVEAALDLAGIVREVTVLEFNSGLKADEVLVQKLKQTRNAAYITNAKTKQILGDGQKVTAIEYEDRLSGTTQKIDIDGIFVQIGLSPNSHFLKGTVELTSHGEIIVDEKGRTTAPGIYAAGDVTTAPYKQIVISMGDGAKVALAAFEDRMHGK